MYSHLMTTSSRKFLSFLQISAYHGEFTTLLQSVAAKWDETATTLQAQASQVKRTAQELQTSFSSGLQSFFDEAKKVGCEVGY